MPRKPLPVETGETLREIRQGLGLSALEFGRALGLAGQDRSVIHMVGDWERGPTRGGRALPRHIALLAECLRDGARPSSWPKG